MARHHKASQVPDDGPGNGWYDTLPAPDPAHRLIGEQSADWAVLGAGAVGLAFARRIAELRPDDRISIVDASRVGFGTSGRNAGFMMNAHTHARVKNVDARSRENRLCAYGLELLRHLVESHQIRCDWSECGRIYVAASPQGNAALDLISRGYQNMGEPVRPLDHEEMATLTGSEFYSRGLHAPSSALVQPAALMRGLAATLPDNVTLYEDSPVTAIRRDQKFTLVTPAGELRATKLTLANAVFAEDLGFVRHRIVPMALFASLTRPLTDEQRRGMGVEEFGLLPASQNGATVRLTRDGRIFLRNTLAYGRRKAFDPDDIARARDNHLAAIAKRWPALAGIALAGTWRGIMGFTRNEGVVFGELGAGLYAALSADVSPMTRGAAAGKLLAEMACGIDSEELAVLQSLPRAAWLPPDPILRFATEHRIRKLERSDSQES
jgi:glycine/D-amino acid oxidase-like deaminating enzyme